MGLADRLFENLEAAMSWEPDAVLVANAASTHAATAVPFAASGVPVLVEKPIATTLDDADDMIAAARAGGAPFMVGYNLRFHPPLVRLTDVVRTELGDVWVLRASAGQHLASWRPGTDYRTSVTAQDALGGGAVLELSHEVDLALCMLGRATSVSARTGRMSDLDIDCEDFAEIVLDFENGSVACIHLDLFDWLSTRWCRVVGSGGTVHWEAGHDGVVLHEPNGSSRVAHDGTATDRNAMYREELRAFFGSIESGATPPVTADDGRRTLAACLAAKLAARQGGKVAV